MPWRRLGGNCRATPSTRRQSSGRPDRPLANDSFGDQGSAKYAAAFNLDPVMLRQNTRRAALESSRAAEDAAARIADQMPAIAEAIRPATRPDAPAPDDRKASSEAA